MIKFCVFDLDGTLVNSIGDIAAAMNRSLLKMGHKTYTNEEYCKMVGDGMYMLCKRALQDAPETDVKRLVSIYKEDYINHCCEKTVAYDGMLELVKELNDEGILCAILSNKPHEQVMEIAKKLFSKELFSNIVGHSEKFLPKPDPASLINLIGTAGFEKSETAYVGDSDVDIMLGRRADVFTVGVAWGLRGEEELLREGAEKIAYNAEQLKDILLKR